MQSTTYNVLNHITDVSTIDGNPMVGYTCVYGLTIGVCLVYCAFFCYLM